jgi:hypothetical protein
VIDWLNISEIVRNVGFIIGGAIGIYLAWRRVTVSNKQAEAAIRQADLARRDHVAELFNRAVGQLTDSKLEVRLAAIYTLRQIGKDFSDLADPVFETLAAYLREERAPMGTQSRRWMFARLLLPFEIG